MNRDSPHARRCAVLATVLIPGLESAVVHVMISDARHRLCRLAIAMRRYELEHGELPESFDDLAPTYMEEVCLSKMRRQKWPDVRPFTEPSPAE